MRERRPLDDERDDQDPTPARSWEQAPAPTTWEPAGGDARTPRMSKPSLPQFESIEHDGDAGGRGVAGIKGVERRAAA